MKYLLSSAAFIFGIVLVAMAQTTRETQEGLTPEAVVERLIEGNERFVQGQSLARDSESAREASAEGQYPKAFVLSCIDSRAPVEKIFDQGIGDLFVGRVAGNVVNEDQLGSMEFATQVAGTKVIFVLGHTQCGAIKGAQAEVEMGNLTQLVEKVQPAIEAVGRGEGEDSLLEQVTRKHILLTIEAIRENSEILAGLEEDGSLLIVGGLYDLASGEVSLLSNQ